VQRSKYMTYGDTESSESPLLRAIACWVSAVVSIWLHGTECRGTTSVNTIGAGKLKLSEGDGEINCVIQIL
jgi:hypothetical protein